MYVSWQINNEQIQVFHFEIKDSIYTCNIKSNITQVSQVWHSEEDYKAHHYTLGVVLKHRTMLTTTKIKLFFLIQ